MTPQELSHADRAPWRARRHAISNPSSHATARVRLRPGERRARYASPASMARPSQHPAHGALHRAGAGPVQGFLARIIRIASETPDQLRLIVNTLSVASPCCRSFRHRRDKTMAGYAQVTLVGVDLDHVTTSRHDPQGVEYRGTVTLRARSQGIDFTYAYPSRTERVSLMLSTGRQKACSATAIPLFRACMDVIRQEAGCDRRGRSGHGKSGGRSIRRPCVTSIAGPYGDTQLYER